MVKHWSPKPNTAGSSPVLPELVNLIIFFYIIFKKCFKI